jgi:hypothetical protein
MLPEGKGCGTVQFCALAQLVQATLARLLVLLCVHSKIVLREATSRVGMIEGAIAAIQDVDLRE